MQCLPVEFGLIWTNFIVVLSIRIDAIANERMADMRHMHADLMRAPRFQRAFNHRRFGECLNHPVMRDGMATL